MNPTVYAVTLRRNVNSGGAAALICPKQPYTKAEGFKALLSSLRYNERFLLNRPVYFVETNADRSLQGSVTWSSAPAYGSPAHTIVGR